MESKNAVWLEVFHLECYFLLHVCGALAWEFKRCCDVKVDNFNPERHKSTDVGKPWHSLFLAKRILCYNLLLEKIHHKNSSNCCVFKESEKYIKTHFLLPLTLTCYDTFIALLIYIHIIWIFLSFIPSVCNFIVGLERNFFMHIYSCITKKFNRHVTAWLTTYSKFFDNFRFFLSTWLL